ncbi:MAG: hypothetical protein C0467_29410 [Planctomycetaceae bacterium]|nr:hypothetical protein [Planctomycetaceae bacterium]
MKSSRYLIAIVGWICGSALIVGCSSSPPPVTNSDEQPSQKTDKSGVGHADALEAPPSPPGAKKK